MGPFDIVLLALLGATFVCAVIELGVSGYLVSQLDYTLEGYYTTYHYNAPGEVKFLVFCAVWTLLVSIALIVLPLVFGRSSNGGPIFTIVTFVINVLTWIFWLAGFAAFAALFSNFPGTFGATLAFAVILWLIFCVFLVLSILTALGVISVDRLGYQPVFRRSGAGAGAGPSAGAPMSTAGGAQPVV